MNTASWIVLSVIVVLVGAIVAASLIRRKKGRSCCDGDCAGCTMSGCCHPTDSDN